MRYIISILIIIILPLSVVYTVDASYKDDILEELDFLYYEWDYRVREEEIIEYARENGWDKLYRNATRLYSEELRGLTVTGIIYTPEYRYIKNMKNIIEGMEEDFDYEEVSNMVWSNITENKEKMGYRVDIISLVEADSEVSNYKVYVYGEDDKLIKSYPVINTDLLEYYKENKTDSDYGDVYWVKMVFEDRKRVKEREKFEIRVVNNNTQYIHKLIWDFNINKGD